MSTMVDNPATMASSLDAAKFPQCCRNTLNRIKLCPSLFCGQAERVLTPTTLPLEYVWRAQWHMPVTNTNGLTDTVSFTWDFGDESDGSGRIITHTYSLTGEHTATVTAMNSTTTLTVTTQVTIIFSIYPIYLPLVVKSSEEILAPPHPSPLLAGEAWLGLIIVGAIILCKRRIYEYIWV
jgi:hypothetical protein